jgi:hypothetical protein
MRIPPGRRIALSNSVCRLIKRSASINGSMRDLLCIAILTHEVVAALPAAFGDGGELQERILDRRGGRCTVAS